MNGGSGKPISEGGAFLARRGNPPRQAQISYRIGDQGTLRDWMLSRMPELGLKPSDPTSFLFALVSAWAAVGDNLTFYQERIANEGYWRTATEELSVRALLNSVGYHPAPAMSATTALAFTLIDAAGGPQRLLIPKGSAVQSVPRPGETPLVFETLEDLEAAPKWNELKLWRQPLGAAAAFHPAVDNQLSVLSAPNVIKPGMPMILPARSNSPGGAGATSAAVVVVLSSAEADPTPGVVRLGWDVKIEVGAEVQLTQETLVCTKEIHLFGANAKPWTSQTDANKALNGGHRIGAIAVLDGKGGLVEPAVRACPPLDCAAFAIDDTGHVYTAMGDGVLRLAPGGGWTPISTPSLGALILCLICGEGEEVFVGTQRGEVLRSVDGGRTWYSLIGPATAKPSASKLMRLPTIPVLSLALIDVSDGSRLLAAGTPSGVWTAPRQGGDWTAWSKGLPGFVEDAATAAASVWALAPGPRAEQMFAATDKDIFVSDHPGEAWRSVWNAPPLPPPRPLEPPTPAWPTLLGPQSAGRPAPRTNIPPRPIVEAYAFAIGSDGAVFAGTADGLAICHGETWRAGPKGPAAGAGAPLAITHLAISGEGLFAGTTQGLFTSLDQGDTWQSVSAPFDQTAVVAIAAKGDQVLAAQAFAGFSDTDWPQLVDDFAVGQNVISLDSVYPTLQQGDWIAFVDDSTKSPWPPFALQVMGLSSIVRQEAFASGRVTQVATAGLPRAINPRTTRAFISSQSLELATPTVNTPNVLIGDSIGQDPAEPGELINLDGAFPDLEGRDIAVSGLRPRLEICAPTGGVLTWGDPSQTGGVAIGIQTKSNLDVNALMVSGSHGVVMGADTGVFRLTAAAVGDELSAQTWMQHGEFPAGAASPNCLSVAELSDGAILAGTTDGVWRCAQGNWVRAGFTSTRVGVIVAGALGVFAGAADGLYQSCDDGATWTKVWPTDLTQGEESVTALAIVDSSSLLLGNSQGCVYLYQPGTAATRVKLPHANCVWALASANNVALAGTNIGAFASSNGGATWTACPPLDQSLDVRAVALDKTGEHQWYAARGIGIFRDGERLSFGLANDFRALVLDDSGRLHAGSQMASALLRSDGSPGPDMGEPQNLGVVSDPSFSRMLSSPGPVSADLRRVWDEIGVSLPKASLLAISNADRGEWTITDGGAAVFRILQTAELNQYRLLIETELAIVNAVAGEAGARIWSLLTHDGMPVTLSSLPGQVAYSLNPSSFSVSERARVTSSIVASDVLKTSIKMALPLMNAYDAASVSIAANVVGASHGETPTTFEAIGSGDNSIPSQAFTLRRLPMSVLAGAPGQGPCFQIQVRVKSTSPYEAIAANAQFRSADMTADSILWTQVDSFEASQASDAHYVVDEDEDGEATVTFGDGINGRRLPTGQENVVALYQIGAGSAGNLDAGRLTLLKKRPPGVKAVTNPIPALGGADRSQLSQTRQMGPINARALGRMVSARDLQTFLAAQTGVAKVRVDELLINGAPEIHFTVAYAQDALTAPGSNQLGPSQLDPDVLMQVLLSSGPRKPTMAIGRYRPCWFNVAANLTIDPAADVESVLAACVDRLTNAFGFDTRDLADEVRDSTVISCLQKVPYVTGVTMLALYRLGDAPQWRPGHALQSQVAYPSGDGSSVAPAELLLINATPAGINLALDT